MFKEKYKPLLKMTGYIKEYKKEFLISILYGILNSIFSLMTVLTGAYITSAALSRTTVQTVLYLFIPLAGFICGKGLFSYLEMCESHLVAYNIIAKIRGLLYDAVSATAPQSTAKTRSGNITAAIIDDVESTEVFYAHTAGAYIIAVICTVLYLMVLACPSASDEEIRHAAQVAMADGFIQKLDHGYDTYAGERGVQLSGGEKQRIAIARAVLKKSPILLMDEAASNLDSESEALFRQALNNIRKGKTIITIAHRPSTVKEADRVICIAAGQVVS